MGTLRYYLSLLLTIPAIVGFLDGMPWLGISSLVFILVMDTIFPHDSHKYKISYPALARLPLYLQLALFGVLYASFFNYVAVSGGTLSGWAMAGSILTLSWLGLAPGVAVVHELYHGNNRVDRFLGFVGSIILGNPGRVTSHNYGHHIHVSSARDFDTPRRGELIHTFVFRAAIANWIELVRLDQKRNAGRGAVSFLLGSKTVRAVLIIVAVLGAVFYFTGVVSGIVITTSIFITMLLTECINYVQHYGLQRVVDAPVAPHHCWNHLSPTLRAATFEITNHSPHHLQGDHPFYDNRPDASAPQMPNGVVCLLTAILAPPLWNRLIAKPRLRHWDFHYADPDERLLAREANRLAGWQDWLGEFSSSSRAVRGQRGSNRIGAAGLVGNYQRAS